VSNANPNKTGKALRLLQSLGHSTRFPLRFAAINILNRSNPHETDREDGASRSGSGGRNEGLDARPEHAGRIRVSRAVARIGWGERKRTPTQLAERLCRDVGVRKLTPTYAGSGAWDIGIYEQTLEEPIIEHVIGVDGRVGAYQWLPRKSIDGEEWFCGTTRLTPRRGKTLLPGYSAIDEAALWFQSPIALPLHKVTVSHSAVNENNPFMPIVYEIDLDNDGISDFLKWDFPGYENFVFINLDGEWHVFEDDYDDQKGCC
jgi:hypothetical protein